MGNPYLDVVTGATQVKPPSPNEKKKKLQEAAKTNPYMEAALGYNSGLEEARGVKREDDFQKMQQETLHPGVVKSTKQFVSELPNAFATLGKEVATHPLRSAESLVLGLMDVGPAAVNFGNSLIGKIFPGYLDPEKGGVLGLGYEKLPSLSKAFADYNDKHTSDAQTAISEGSKMFGAYEIGGGVTGGARSLSGQALGNILGGQIVVEPETSGKDRAKQAVFDGLFGVAMHYAPKAITAAADKVSGTKAATPETITSVLNSIDDHAKTSQMALKELPADEVTKLGGVPALLERTKTNIVKGLEAQGHTGAAQAVAKLEAGTFSNIDELARAAKAKIQGGFRTSATQGGVSVPTPKAEIPPQAGVDAIEVPATNPFMHDGNAVKTPEIKYISKKSLGKDENGAKRLATTEVDSKTGNAIVYYAKELDNPENALLKQQVLDHEMGHVFDKRVNEFAGNISAELPNYAGNAANLDNVLGNFARSLNDSVESVVKKLQSDISKLAAGHGANPGEQFAEAFSKFRAAPDEARKAAPTFSALMEFKPVPERFSTHHFTEADAGASVQATRDAKIPKSMKPLADLAKKAGTEDEFLKQARAGHTEGIVPQWGTRNQYLKKSMLDDNGSGAKGVGPKGNAYELKQVAAGKKPAYLNGAIDSKTLKAVAKKNGLVYMEKNGREVVARSNEEAQAVIDAKNQRELGLALGYEDLGKPMGKKELSQFYREATGDNRAASRSPKEKTTKRKDSVATGDEPQSRASKSAGGKIASTGLDTGKRVEGKSSFNPDQIDAPQDVEMFFNKMDAQKGNFSEQRISKSNEDLKDLARLVGITEDDLINLKPGSIANSETLLASRQLILNKVHEMVNTLKGIDPATMTDAEAKVVRDQFVRLIAIQKSVAGLRTEAANALRSFGVELRPGENFAIEELAAKLKQFGLGDEASQLADFSNKLAKDFELSPMQRAGGAALQTWYAAILSGPKTTARNILSTGGNILTDLAAKSFNPRQWKEIPTSVSALLRGWNEAKGEFAQEMKDAFLLREPVGTDTGKFADFGTMRSKEPIFTGRFATYGKITEVVGRALNAQDKFLSAGAREMEQAALKVYSPGMSKEISTALSKYYAEQSVYHGTPKGITMQALVGAAEYARAKQPLLKILVPFVKTVGNVIDRQFDYVPVFSYLRMRPEFIARQVQEFEKVSKVKLNPAEREMVARRMFDQQMGRASMGTALTVAFTAMAQRGLVSGAGPSNYNERLQLQRTGWRPNSIKIGDTWIPYSYLGPLSGILSIAGNIHDKVTYDNAPGKDISTLVGSGLVGWMQSELDNSFLSGVANLLDAMSGASDPKKYLTNLGTGLVPIPAAYSQTKDMIFRQQYETNGFVDSLRKKLGLTGNVFGMDPLHPKLDAMGDEMTNDLIYGISPSSETHDQISNFLTANDIIVSVPLKNQDYAIPGKKEKVKMTPDQYEAYVRGSGQEIKKQLSALIPRMDRLTQEQKQDLVKTTVDSIREEWRYKILLKSN